MHGSSEERQPAFPQWSIHLPPEMREQIDTLRREQGVSRAEMVRQILALGLERFTAEAVAV